MFILFVIVVYFEFMDVRMGVIWDIEVGVRKVFLFCLYTVDVIEILGDDGGREFFGEIFICMFELVKESISLLGSLVEVWVFEEMLVVE